MGCGDPQEKLENKIMEMNFEKIELQMERYKQMKLLGQDIDIIKPKESQTNSINNNDIKNNINNSKRKTMTVSSSSKTGKGRRSKSMKSVRMKNDIKI